MHLQSSNLNCELSKLMKKDANIINEKVDRPYLFGYNSWLYSYEKLKTKNIMKKYYTIYPLPKNKCSHFFIFLKGTNDANTKILASSVGKESRVLRAGSYVKSLNKDDYGDYYWCVHVRSHPLYKEKILDYLTYAAAAIGVIESIYQFMQGNLSPTQAATLNVFFVTLSQVGSMIRSIKAEIQET
jgi:hypothetical protein